MRVLRTAALVVLAFAAIPAGAQEPAAVFGRLVVAGSNEPIADATVRLVQPGSTREIVLRSDGEGRFARLGVRPGRYEAKIERPGFAAVDVVGIEMRSSDRVRLNLEMTPWDEAPFKRQTVRYHRPLVNVENATMETRIL